MSHQALAVGSGPALKTQGCHAEYMWCESSRREPRSIRSDKHPGGPQAQPPSRGLAPPLQKNHWPQAEVTRKYALSPRPWRGPGCPPGPAGILAETGGSTGPRRSGARASREGTGAKQGN